MVPNLATFLLPLLQSDLPTQLMDIIGGLAVLEENPADATKRAKLQDDIKRFKDEISDFEVATQAHLAEAAECLVSVKRDATETNAALDRMRTAREWAKARRLAKRASEGGD